MSETSDNSTNYENGGRISGEQIKALHILTGKGGSDVAEGFQGGATGESSVTRNRDHVLVASLQVTGGGHSEGGRECSSGMAGAVAIVFRFGAQEESIEPFILADGFNSVTPPGQHFVDVALVGDIHDKLVGGSVENAVERDGEFHHSQVGAEVAAGAGQGSDEGFADLLRKRYQLVVIQGP